MGGKFIKNNIKRIVFSVIGGVFLSLFFYNFVKAIPPLSPYLPGETLDPNCAPGDPNCTVLPSLTGTSTPGNISFYTGTTTLSGDTELFWDNINKRLGVGTSTPSEKLHVIGNILGIGNLTISNTITTTQLSVTSTSTLGTVISGTWQGNIISTQYGGTGLSSIGAANQILGVNAGGTGLEYKNISSLLTAGTGISITGTTNATIANTGILSLTAGPGISISSGQNPTITNLGVLSLNSATGTLTLQGTPNQVNVNTSGNTITLSLPQDIHTGASPTFAGLSLSSLTPGSVLFAGTGGTISQNNSKFFWDNTNFRLGIGTSTPVGILHVATGTVNALVVNNSGNVGIGTTAPSEKLHIIGNALITGTGTFQSSPLTIGNLVLSHAGLTASRTFTFPDVSDTLVSLTATQTLTNKTLGAGSTWQGNVISTQYGGTGLSSIGSANQILGVNAGGTGLEYKNISSLLTAGTGISITGTTNVTISNTGILSLTAGPGISISSGQNPTITNTGVLSINSATGALTLQGTPNQVNVSTVGSTIILSTPQDIHTGASPTFAGLSLSSLTPGSVLFAGTGGTISQNNSKFFWDNTNFRLGIGTSTPVGILHVATGTVNALVVNNSGNVGIGTTTPGQKLDVAGGYIRSDTGFCIGTSCITDWPAGGGGGVSGSGTTNYIAKWTGSTTLGNSIITDDGTLVLISGQFRATGTTTLATTGGNVGIGTTTPATLLQVVGTTTARTILPEADNVYNLGASGFRWANIYAATGTFGNTIIIGSNTIQGSSTTTLFTTGNPNQLVLGANGNVGIGIATPNNRLQVVDLINFDNTDFNTFLGFQAGKNVVAGAQYNTFIGYQAGFMSSTGASSLADYNTAIGYQTLFSNTTGRQNTAVGSYALYSNTTGIYNTAIGDGALYSNTTGGYNTAIGLDALYSNTTGDSNTAIGLDALYSNTTGNYNTALGDSALFSNTTGDFNTAVGSLALFDNTTGYSNTAVGSLALFDNTTGYQNTALGRSALYSNTTGYQNTALGNGALYSNTEGYRNTAIGFLAGRYIANGTTANATSTYSVYLGANTKASFSGATNEIVIGYDAVGAGSNSVVLGNDSITKTILKGNVGIGTTTPGYKLDVQGQIRQTFTTNCGTLGADAAGAIYCAGSSLRYKTNIQDLNFDINKFLALNPRSFDWNTSTINFVPGEKGSIGFIAEEVNQVFPQLVRYKDGQPEGIKYELLPIYLFKIIKNLILGFKEKVKASLNELGIIIENGIARIEKLFVREITIDFAQIEKAKINELTSKKFCLEGDDGETICLDKNQLKELIRGLNGSTTDQHGLGTDNNGSNTIHGSNGSNTDNNPQESVGTNTTSTSESNTSNPQESVSNQNEQNNSSQMDINSDTNINSSGN
jgi:hypothetical protein